MNSLQELYWELVLLWSELPDKEQRDRVVKIKDALEAIAQTTPQPQVPEGYVLVQKSEIEKLQDAADNADLYANDYGQEGRPGEQFDEIANVINDMIAAATSETEGEK